MEAYRAIKHMEQRMFSDDLFNQLCARYNGEIKTGRFTLFEDDLLEGYRVLETELDQLDQKKLKELELLFLQYARESVSIAFRQGMYTGFQQFFVEDTIKEPYSTFWKRRRDGAPHALSLPEQFSINFLTKQYEELKRGLDETLQSHLLNIFLAWQERIDGVMRHGFYFGYRYAHLTIERVERNGEVTRQILHKKLMTEYDLGMISLREELDNSDSLNEA